MSALWLLLTLLPLLGGAERFSCRGRILGAYYADAKSGCKAFHVCVRVAGGGIRDFRFFCPPGTLFHQEAQTCTDWGDDDALACPADLYDGQFDLYKIGSGLDSRKVASQPPREEEPEFHLQRAETGDRRANAANSANFANSANTANFANSANSVSGGSDLRAAHSSDFFSGARDRGRDDYTPSGAPPPSRPPPRRPTPPRPTAPAATYYPTTARAAPVPQKHDSPPKRKLVRKRPIYVSSTASPSPFTQATTKSFSRFEDKKVQQPAIPPQFKEYKDEYVEVPRVTPKTRQQQFSVTPSFGPTTQADRFSKKEVETFYESKSTAQPQRPIKLRNNFNVAPESQRQEVPRSQVNVVSNGVRSTPDYEPTKATANYRNFNSISNEPEKKYFSNTKKEYYATTPAARSEPPRSLNTVAYNTNVGFDAQPVNYPESEEDDGQYRLSPDEDDGQYRPELYERGRQRERGHERGHERGNERELLSGAHSLNIAASGNRLPDDQKPRKAQTSQPRPFKPAPTPTLSAAPEAAHSTYRPSPSTQRPFDFVQTYTTTSRPEAAVTTPEPRVSSVRPAEPRTSPRAPPPPTIAPPAHQAPSAHQAPPAHKPPPAHQAPAFTRPATNKEDASYDYAYYDSDPGFSEYDHIEEFGKTKGKKA